ncbi:MmyB family transcriptional regulator [Rhodococcus koreensis]
MNALPRCAADEPFATRVPVRDGAMRRTVIGIVRTSAPSGIPTGAWIDDLLATSPEFTAMWERNDAVRPHVRLRVRLRTASGTEAELDQVVLQAVDDPTHRLVVFVPAM